MAPPAKRRKRNIVTDDDDDQDEQLDESPRLPSKNSLNYYFTSPDASAKSFDVVDNGDPTPPSPSPVRKSTRSTRLGPAVSASTRSRQSKTIVSKSPSQSPSKAKKPIEEKGKSANIRTLFSKQSQKLQSEPKPNGVSNGPPVPSLDLVDDSLSDDEEISYGRAVGTSLVGKKAQKRIKERPEIAPKLKNSGVTAGQQFLRRADGPSSSYPAVLEDRRPWSERFGPANLDELAVHKRKVADVRRWLDDVLHGRMRQRLLILKGSAGTGKTITMQLLAKDMGFEIAEWRNPTGPPSSFPGSLSASAQFEEFMGRGRKFGQLDFEEDDSTQMTNGTKSIRQTSQDGSRNRVMLIEEFPNTFMRSGSALTSFRQTVLQFLVNNTPSSAAFGNTATAEPITPAVMIISETLLTTTSASADSFTAHRLLGAEILRHPGTGIIEFNDIAPTLMNKALELVVKKEARVSGRRRTPGPLVLKRLSEMGDIRNATAALEFLCLKGDDDADWGAKVAFTKTKKTSKNQALTEGEQKSLELISRREASLGIFHAVGKVVYNKRDEHPYAAGSDEALAEKLPPHLATMCRNKRSQVSVDTLIDETGTDTSTFISALHENYVLSCERTGMTDPNSSIDYINGCIEYLSESDLLNPTWDIFFGGKGFLGGGRDQGSHILRQDEMAFETAVRGLLFSLPCPVKRKSGSSSTRGGGDTFKMFYPTSIKLWRDKEELEDLVDLWASKMLKGEGSKSGSASQQPTQPSISGALAFRKGKASSVGDWAGNRSELKYAAPKPPPKVEATDLTEEGPPLISLGSSARKEMILERLPYMAQIMRGRRTTLYSLGVRDVDKVVSFQGIRAPLLDEESADAGEEELGVVPAGEAWATDKPTEDGSTPRKKRTRNAMAPRKDQEKSEGSMISNLQVQKLVLSDDDIEDDDD